MTELKIEYIPIDSITPYEANAKLHPAEQIEQIKKSIQDYGFRDPVGIWKGEIVEGHGRIIAAKELGMKEVPVIRLDDMTDEQRREYALVHNQTTLNSGFDFSVLDAEIEGLPEFDVAFYGFELSESEKEEQTELKEAAYEDKISVVIDCKNESEAERIFMALTDEGYECRISTL